MTRSNDSQTTRWAVIMAGGSGTRLQSFTRELWSGDERPKQFCTLYGGDTLLGHTRSRIASAVPAEQTAYVVVKAHAPFYSQQLAGIPAERILAQPMNRGTTAAIAFAVARIAALHSRTGDAEAVLGFFPADHYFADEDDFARTLDRAYRLAGQHANRILLLGAQPEHAEVEYGWIEPGAALNPVTAGHDTEAPIFRVNRFWEKPSLELARGLLDRGCLWNTFVMVGRVRSFFDALQAAVPAMLDAFEPMLDFGGVAEEPLGRLYSSIAPGDFSQQVLSNIPERLAVLGFNNAGWSDLGTPERLLDTWSRFGVKPPRHARGYFFFPLLNCSRILSRCFTSRSFSVQTYSIRS